MIRSRQEVLQSGRTARHADVNRCSKRLFDLALALPAMIVALPVIAVAALLVRATSPGPAIFAQTRVGRNGTGFRCYKIRTMHTGTPSVPTHEAKASYVTGVGRVLRQTKLDELPQLWNVIRGDMSLVGPRPCLPGQDDLIRHRERLGVLSLRPGITGLAQVRGIDMSDPRRCAEADAEYLARWSPWLDLTLLLRTLRRSLPPPSSR
ncbi:sugar transferase [Chelativorans composti]|jgi:Sugar transferases involved in lipopolysaccharide synthesis|uniref:Sugar transferase n=1 Tax=Chelativorans composti TaxID=768533 RepID=A0ABW5DH07_9HYPH